MPLVAIEESSIVPAPGSVMFNVEAPRAGSASELLAVEFKGWVIGRRVPVIAVEISHKGVTLRRVSLRRRLDVTRQVLSKLMGSPQSQATGFHTAISLFGLPLTCTLQLSAVLADGSSVRLATVTAARSALASSYQPDFQPLLVISLGRTGTTWAMRLLSQHPDVITHQEYPYETRAAQYWVHMARVLSEPANPGQSATSTFFVNPFWVGSPPFAEPWSSLFDWTSGREHIGLLASHCLRTIDSFYAYVAAIQGKTSATRYVEKAVLSNPTLELFSELYEHTKVIFLVRDPRDVISSVLSFNAKRGTVEFGRSSVSTDEEYVDVIRKQTELLANAWHQSQGSVLLRYEDLVLQPEATLSNVFRGLGLDARDATVAKTLAQASEQDAKLQFHQTSASPAASIGRWRRDLAPTVKDECARLLPGVLREFGYRL